MLDQAIQENVFPREELQQRQERVRAAMARDSLDLLLLSDPCNIYYLTGYDAWSFYTPQMLIVPAGGAPIWFGRQMDVYGVSTTTWLTPEQIVGYPDRLVQNPPEHPLDALVDTLRERGMAGGRIGVEKNSYYLDVGGYERLQAGLTDASWHDASLLVNWVRFIKSPLEIGLLREAGQLLTHSMMSGIDALASGVRDNAVVATIYQTQIEGTNGIGGMYTSSPAFFAAGERTSAPHLPWTGRTLPRGTPINLELMGNRKRYQVTQGRTAYLGKPPARLLELEKILLEALDAVLGFIRPGVLCEDVEAVLRRVLARHSIDKSSRCGYSQGIAYPPTGGELTASFRAGDRTELQPGAVMHFLPALWQDQHSIMISEPLLVTDSGCECFCTTPRQLFVRD